MYSELPTRAEIVIIGGGVIGVSTAYHLALLGRRDVLLLEQGQLTCGTTWHAAGLVGKLRSSRSMTRTIAYSAELYARLEAETSLATGWKQCGSVQVARTPERLEVLRRNVSRAAAFGIEAELISPQRAGELWPVMATDDLTGAVWLPGDGKVNPTDLTGSLAKGARNRGVRIAEGIRVEAVDRRAGRVSAVHTDNGVVECDTLVICAGQWSKEVGRMAGVRVPLHSAEHFYAVTEPIEGVHPDLPVLRDPDGYIYFKEEVGGLVMGGFEPEAKPWVGPHDLPEKFEFGLLPADLDQVDVLMRSAQVRVPIMETVGIRTFLNGPESFTPDGNPVLGRCPEVANVYVGAGFNSAGIASAGGAGLSLAEWIVEGRPSADLTAADVRRFGGQDENEHFLRSRVIESLGLHYAMPWPNRQFTSARSLRLSPVHQQLNDAGACFTSVSGWEVPYFYGAPGMTPAVDYTFGRAEWIAHSAEEQLAAHHGVALFDHSARTGFVLKGLDSEAAIAWLSAADTDLSVGGAVDTPLLNEQGGYESTVTVLRQAADEYLIMTGPGRGTHDRDHIERSLPVDCRSVLVEVTGRHAVFTLLGPHTDSLLAHLGPVGAGRRDLGMVTVWMFPVRLGAVAGWEIVAPCETAVGLLAQLRAAGAELGLRLAGSAAWDVLRIEAGRPEWGKELGPGLSPQEAGTADDTKVDGDVPFVGRDALRERTARTSFVALRLLDSGATLWGGEPVRREGTLVGHLTSGAVSAFHGTSVGLVQVPVTERRGTPSDADTGQFDVEVMGRRYEAKAIK